ncbi:hypothetical protein ABT369_29935 [Dactylosporangium sp. NPDC000244]|uniref:hypothetical protein n=1 Tax=Dactylosporangium sp. NPDC000244 TaxID=3154365 RepID=UPI0033246D90
MAEPEIIENGDNDDDEPLPGGRPFPILLVAVAVAFVVLAFAAVFIGFQVYSGHQAEAERAAEDAAPRSPAPSRSSCLDLHDYGCDPARRLPVTLDQLMEAQSFTAGPEWANNSGTHTLSMPMLTDQPGTAAGRLTVEHAHQVVYSVRCEANSTGTTPLTPVEIGYLKLCGNAALPGNDPAVGGAVQWLANNIHVAANGLVARYQCSGVAFSLHISALHAELDITVPDDRKACGPA